MVLIVGDKSGFNGLQVFFSSGVAGLVLGIVKIDITDAGDDGDDSHDNQKLDQSKALGFTVNG